MEAKDLANAMSIPVKRIQEMKVERLLIIQRLISKKKLPRKLGIKLRNNYLNNANCNFQI